MHGIIRRVHLGSIVRGRGEYQLQSQQGIPELETAIILIAFIVVASVFAYTVLTAGVFSSQKANESVNVAIQEVRSSITINGNTIAYKGSVDIDGVTTTSDGTDAATKIDYYRGGAPGRSDRPDASVPGEPGQWQPWRPRGWRIR